MGYYPICLNLHGRSAVVVGGGAVAERKAMGLLEAEARVTVVSPDVTIQLRAMAETKHLTWIPRVYQSGDLQGASLAISATDDPDLNAQVRQEAGALGIPVNVVDDHRDHDFITPAVVRRGDLTVAISTGGKSPALAARLRQQFERALGTEYGEFVDLAGQFRAAAKASQPDPEQRKQLWYRAVDSGALDLLRHGNTNGARQSIGEILASSANTDAGSLEARVGNTPLLRLKRITVDLPTAVEVWVKAEWFNPSGSIKDRPAVSILRRALEVGALDPSRDRRLLDSTSGNMGIAYATFCAARGIGVTLAVPENASPERLSILRALGAELVVTDALEGSDGAMKEAERLSIAHPDRFYYANQYDNPANWQAHYATTGPEVWTQTRGQVTHFVAGLGTSGTLVGTGRRLQECNPSIQLVAIQPDAPFHGLEGLKHMDTAIKPGIYDETITDQTVTVSTEEAYAMVLRLAREEGLFVGVSAGAAVSGALKVAHTIEEGVLVTVLPDAGFKYLSDDFWK